MSHAFRESTNVSSVVRGMTEMSVSKTPGSASRSRMRMNSTKNQNIHQKADDGKKKGLRKREMTPTRNSSFAANSTNPIVGDRYIGVRRNDVEQEYASFLLTQQKDTLNTSSSAPCSPAKNNPEQREAGEQMKSLMRGKSTGNLTDCGEDERILVYRKNSVPQPAVGHINQAKVLYSAHCIQPASTTKKANRHIVTAAERILDAPDFCGTSHTLCRYGVIDGISDDYYMNVLDWSSTGVVAVALGFTLYLWNADTGDIEVLFELDENNEFNLITSVKWSADGKYLACGFKDGTLKLYDPSRKQPVNGKLELRTMRVPRNSRNGNIAWRGATVSAGYQSGQIIHHDVRVPQHIIGSFNGHDREVVGLNWSLDEKYLASGSGDQTVRLWDSNLMSSESTSSVYVLNEHIGSVRAVQFCNFKSSMLASGGGHQDKSVKTWNIHSGEMISSHEMGSAVNSIVFNKDYKEMLTALGDGSLKIMRYPNFQQIATLAGHAPERALSVTASPCGQYVMSAGGDETLRMWIPFKIDKSTSMMKAHNSGLMSIGIR